MMKKKTRKITTKAQIEAARRNGALSHGPTSPEGKAISSRNAISHGFTARHLHLSPDEQASFDAHRAIYYEEFLPQTAYHRHLTDQCATASWQLARAAAIQSSLVDLEVALATPDIAEAFEVIDNLGVLAIGFKSLTDHSPAFHSIDRHQARLVRQFFRYLTELKEMRKTSKNNSQPPSKAAQTNPTPQENPKEPTT
jgi:hypothetical protein